MFIRLQSGDLQNWEYYLSTVKIEAGTRCWRRSPPDEISFFWLITGLSSRRLSLSSLTSPRSVASRTLVYRSCITFAKDSLARDFRDRLSRAIRTILVLARENRMLLIRSARYQKRRLRTTLVKKLRRTRDVCCHSTKVGKHSGGRYTSNYFKRISQRS